MVMMHYSMVVLLVHYYVFPAFCAMRAQAVYLFDMFNLHAGVFALE